MTSTWKIKLSLYLNYFVFAILLNSVGILIQKSINRYGVDELRASSLEAFKDLNNTAMFRGGASFADAITFGAEKADKKLMEEFGKVRGKKVLPFKADGDLTDYLQLYTDLSAK